MYSSKSFSDFYFRPKSQPEPSRPLLLAKRQKMESSKTAFLLFVHLSFCVF